MKKILLSCILLLACVLSSCTPGEVKPSKDAPVTLTLWHYYNGATKETFDNLVQIYNEGVGKEHGILVDAHAYSGVNVLADAVFASATKELGAPNLPDIFATYADNAYRIHSLVEIASLDHYLDKKTLKSYRSEFLQEGIFDGNLKIMPVAKSTELLYVNQTDFEVFAKDMDIDMALLSTWEGLSKIAAVYYSWTDAQTPEAEDGKALFGIDSFANFFLVSAKQLGVPMFTQQDGQTKFIFDKNLAKDIWEHMYLPYLKGHYASIGRFRSDDTKAGDLLAYVGSTASANYFPARVETGKDAFHEIDCLALPYPRFEGSEAVAVQQGAGLAVTRSEASRELAAVHFLQWFTEAEQNLTFAVDTGYMPVKNEALNAERVIERLQTGSHYENSDPVMQTAKVLYDGIAERHLYANPPFQGSYEIRMLLERNLQDQLTKDLSLLNEGLARGEARDELLATLGGQDAFATWYDSLVTEIQGLLVRK